MTFWWVPWFLKALGVSTIVLFIGWLKSLKRRKQPESESETPESETTDFWSKEYNQIYEGCISYAERIYQQK